MQGKCDFVKKIITENFKLSTYNFETINSFVSGGYSFDRKFIFISI